MESLLARVFCSYITLYEQAQVRLPRYALLRCRYEGLSPSGQSVKGVRNYNIEYRTLRCHSEERGKAP